MALKVVDMSKGKNLQDLWDALPEERKAAIEQRAQKRIEEYRNL